MAESKKKKFSWASVGAIFWALCVVGVRLSKHWAWGWADLGVLLVLAFPVGFLIAINSTRVSARVKTVLGMLAWFFVLVMTKQLAL
jgi:hypothetical protein